MAKTAAALSRQRSEEARKRIKERIEEEVDRRLAEKTDENEFERIKESVLTSPLMQKCRDAIKRAELAGMNEARVDTNIEFHIHYGGRKYSSDCCCEEDLAKGVVRILNGKNEGYRAHIDWDTRRSSGARMVIRISW